MLTSELLAQVRRIEILTGRLVTETLAGEYLSVFKGRGMEFAEVREYSPGDDVRDIDWNVTARTGKPFVRRYSEERELTVVVACDVSGSQYFGTAGRLKKEAAAELSAVLSFSALQNHDKVGLFLFTDSVEEYVPPKKGRKHVLHLVRDVLAYEPKGRGTKLDVVLRSIANVVKRKCIVFLISDFRLDPANPQAAAEFDRALRLAAHKHDIIPVVIEDPRELALPKAGAVLQLEDPESGREALFDLSDEAARGEHARAAETRRAELDKLFRLRGLDAIRVRADQSVVDPVVAFFRRRMRRLGKG